MSRLSAYVAQEAGRGFATLLHVPISELRKFGCNVSSCCCDGSRYDPNCADVVASAVTIFDAE